MDKLKNTRILSCIGVIGLTLGCFFQYCSYDLFFYNYGIKLINYWEGRVILPLTILIFLYIFKDYVKKYVPKVFESEIGKKVEEINNPKLLLIPTGIIVIFAFMLLSDLSSYSDYLTYEVGFYFFWIGVIAMIGHSFLYNYSNMNNQQMNQNNMNNQQMNQNNMNNQQMNQNNMYNQQMNQNNMNNQQMNQNNMNNQQMNQNNMNNL